MKTEHQQLKEMMSELGYGRGKYFQKLSGILGGVKTESIKVILRPSKKFPKYLKLALWVYGEKNKREEVLKARITILENELEKLKKL